MDISSTRLRENLELFSFPRLSGTEFEKRAFNLAKQKIEGLDLTPEVQTFKFSTFYSRIYPKISFPLVFWIFLTLYLNLNLPFLFVSLILSFSIFFPFFLLTRKPEKIKLGKVLESQNLYVKLSTDSNLAPNEIHDIFFMAHLDSKGQRITARTRGISIFLLTISILSNIIILILRGWLSSLYVFFTALGGFPLLILLIAVIILSTNTTNNKSKGVIDNASGIACVLELLYAFTAKKGIQKNYNLWFVLTGAEESGTMGVRFFYKLIKDIKRDKAIIHNFESLGKSINIIVTKSTLDNHPSYYEFIGKKAEDNNYTLFVNPLSRGIHTDGMYLTQHNFTLFEYESSEVGKYMHSEKDSLENVDTDMLQELCNFIYSNIISYFS
ncbi:MAG: M20/M25/M40 family metallo-hydrolase [Promethearchaeota archaeon]|nr:MAG: M20/M25/M40 family metallo-hydrolase [Candidatus Lokiarchaeota archaeon]